MLLSLPMRCQQKCIDLTGCLFTGCLFSGCMITGCLFKSVLEIQVQTDGREFC